MPRSLESWFEEFRRSADPRLLGSVFDAVAPELYHVALHLTGDPVDAEDVLQATCLAALERAGRWDAARPLKPWLLGILANQARLSRSNKQRRPDPERLELQQPREPIADAARAELLEELQSALLRIPAANRSVLLLRLKHELTIGEIAESLARPPGTVRSQLARGLEMLRRTLPAGLAGALGLFVAPPVRGLSAIRQGVLTHAAALQPAVISLSPVVGALLMKKILLALGLLIAGSVALVVVRDPRSTPPVVPVPAGLEAPPAALAPERGAPRIATRHALASAHPAAAPLLDAQSAELPETGAVLVKARWRDTGEPAAGARVTARSFSNALSYPEERNVQTDGAGQARIDGIEPGPIEVGALRSQRVERVLAAGEVVSIELELLPGRDVDGLVVTAAGAPVARAEVWMSERFQWDRGQVVAVTDELGRFRLAAVGRDQSLFVAHPDFAPSCLHHVAGPDDPATLRIVLEAPGATLRGRVLADDGRLLANARVVIGDDVWGEVVLADGRTVAHAPACVASTDARGAFSIGSVPPGSITVRARAQGFGTTKSSVVVTDDGAAFVELVLLPEASVAGRIRNEAGAPLGGVDIESLGTSPSATSRTKTASDGSFLLRGLAPGERELLASHPEHGRARTLLSLTPGQLARWDATLANEPRIFGTLFDPQGTPLSDHGVVLKRNGEHVIRVETDSSGRFTIAQLEDVAYTLQVKQPGDWRRFPVLVLSEVRPSFEPLELRLDPRSKQAVITGFVRGPRAAVLENAEVTLWQEPDQLWHSTSVDAADGAFTITDVPPGTCYVSATAAGYPATRLPAHELAPGERLELGELFLADPARIEGTLSGGDEALLAGLALELYDGNELLDEAVLRTGRRFRSQPLAEGSYQLIARGDGLRSRRIEFRVHPGEELERTLVLEPAAVLEVLLEKPPNARRPRRVFCRLVNDAGDSVWMRTLKPSHDGLRVRVSAPAGSYRLTAMTNNDLFGAARVHIRAAPFSPDPVLIPLLPSGDED